MFYILDENHKVQPVTADDWPGAKPIKNTLINNTLVSTIFCGVNPAEVPALFETQVVCPMSAKLIRYSYFSWQDAVAGHEDLVRRYQQLR